MFSGLSKFNIYYEVIEYFVKEEEVLIVDLDDYKSIT